MSIISYRSYARIDLDSIVHNINEVKKRITPDVKICAVIKADAYGHGAVEVGTALRNSVDFYGVATIEEAVELRDAGLMLPILILGYTLHDKYPDVVKYDVSQTIYNYEDALALSKEAIAQGKKARVHIALDTGMTRIGYMPVAENVTEVKRIKELTGITLEGLFTHMSCADMTDKSNTRMQMERYDHFVEMLDEAGIDIPIKHLANSAEIEDFEDHRYDMVRSGIITYGLYPSEEVIKRNLDLKPALSWYAHVAHVKTVPAGVGVSYGATYVTKKDTRIATITCGYADGYPRSLSNKGYVLIHGTRCPIIGRVCMDQFMVDIGDVKDEVKVEDVVTLIGTDGNEHISVEEIADLAGSFNYEFVCDISKRVKRVY